MSLHLRLELQMVSDTVTIQKRRSLLAELRKLEDLEFKWVGRWKALPDLPELARREYLDRRGDLIVTCASVHSRNRKAGYLIGQGKTMQEAMDEVKMVVEGVYSAKAAMKLAEKYEVSMPIIEQVNQVLFEGKNPAKAVNELMMRDGKIEHSDLPWE